MMTLERDHDREVHALARLIGRLRRTGYEPGLAAPLERSTVEVTGICREIEEHMEFEERVVLPALEAAVPSIGSETARLIGEHRGLRRAGAELAGAVERDAPEARALASRFLAALLAHMDHEEEVFVRASREVTPEQLSDLVTRLSGWALERWLHRHREMLAMAGIGVSVRAVHGGVAQLLVRTPLKDADSRRDLEERLTRKILSVEPTITGVVVQYED